MIKITEKMIKDAFDAAKTDESKNILTALFGPQEKKVKPTLDDYTTIKTYEDACEALGLAPIYSDLSKDADRAICQYSEAQRQYGYIMKLPKHILALMKLEIISRALWGRNWEPMPDTNESKWFYYPYFALWTKDEVRTIDENIKDNFLSTNVIHNTDATFGYLHTYRSSNFIYTNAGLSLCQETEEKAEYFGRQFIELWAEYLKFNFEIK